MEISNNPAENAIRPFVVGRKNWLLSDTPKGADSSAIVYTLVETAKANGVDPYAYLLRVLSLLPYLGKIRPMRSLTSCYPGIHGCRHRCTVMTTSFELHPSRMSRLGALTFSGWLLSAYHYTWLAQWFSQPIKW